MFTGRKRDHKVYHHYTGYIGGIKERSARSILDGQQAELLLPPCQRQVLDPPSQRQCSRHLALNRDSDLTGLLGTVGRPEPVGTQHKLAPFGSPAQDRRLLIKPSLGDACQPAAQFDEFGLCFG